MRDNGVSHYVATGLAMRVKNVLREITLVIADLEVQLGSELRSSPTLCALLPASDAQEAQLIPLNTPDGRPILLNLANAIPLENPGSSA